MNDDLFHEADIAGLSPRRLWMNRHRIGFAHSEQGVGETSPETGDIIRPWLAFQCAPGGDLITGRNSATGDSLDEALTALALKLKILLWNEEN